jgi:ligand-binding sensor domain-containing protein/signal transduction histidine kinase
MADGLPAAGIGSILNTRNGMYWVATRAGLCRFDPLGISPARAGKAHPESAAGGAEPMFAGCPPIGRPLVGSVNVLFEDHAGTVWSGTGAGLFRLRQTKQGWRQEYVNIGLPDEIGIDSVVHSIAEDGQGSLWIGAGSGLYRRRPDGKAERFTTRNQLPADDIRALLVDNLGELWAGTTHGLCRITNNPSPGNAVVSGVYSEKDGIIGINVRSLLMRSNRAIAIGTPSGVSELALPARLPGQGAGRLSFTPVIRGIRAEALAEDADGNLWIGTDNGAAKLSRSGFTSFTPTDGLASSEVFSIFEDQAGELCVTNVGDGIILNRLAGTRFVPTRVGLPKQISYFGWGSGQLSLQDHTGEWWIPTGQGLCRFPRLSHAEMLAKAKPTAVYTTRDGLVTDDIFRLYEDAHGDICVATFSDLHNAISRWERVSGSIHTFSEAEGIPATIPIPRAFCEDRSGNLWIGFEDRILARFHAGRFTLFGERDGVPRGWINALHLDREGRLWMASNEGGVGRIDDPSAAHPCFRQYTPADGLSSNDVWCITEDRSGLIYLGTGRGVDRLNPKTGSIVRYTTADGLVSGEIRTAACDRRGALWFGGAYGISRLVPEPEKPEPPPSVFISGVRVAGVRQPLSEFGEIEAPDLAAGHDQNNIEVEFAGLCFRCGDALRYQYRLEGADRDWSPLTDQRRISYASLAPGRYRFLVRAVGLDGTTSLAPARVAFTIHPPVWRRWWFIALCALSTGFVIYAFDRFRIRRLVELERVRTHIASDLHDDIGSNLSLIAGLSELLRDQAERYGPEISDRLSSIASISRNSVDAMSDIVWAVNPLNDHLGDMIRRMRRFANDALGSKNIEFHFQATVPPGDVVAGAQLRREVYLIFKESIHNLVRHSGCSRAQIELESNHGGITLRICDDGKGFAADACWPGNGLVNLKKRAAKLGAVLKVSSSPSAGTTVLLRTPMNRIARTMSYLDPSL